MNDYQMNKVWHLLPAVEPERRIYWGILAQAIKDVRGTAKCFNKIDRDDAWNWIQSDAIHEGSFVWICDSLDLDPAWVREAI